jgi:hypothetical protein
MGEGWLRRMHWRRRGAWMWPAFVALSVADAAIGHALPPAGDGWNPVGAGIAMAAANLLGIVVLSAPARLALARLRPDLPRVVAKDYAGTGAMLAISLALLAAGLANRGEVARDRRAMADAIVRAQAYIGARAPDRFRRNVEHVDTFAIQPGRVYRTCVPSVAGRQDYCVVVRLWLPVGRSVSFDGYEPNSVLAQGTG